MSAELSLAEMLKRIDKTFGIDKVMSDWDRDVIVEYYAQSGPAYERVHSSQGCMHLALNPDGVFSFDGYLVHPRAIMDEIRALSGKRVLELGCGKGFNSLFMAQHMDWVAFTGMDLLEDHLVTARAKAAEAGVTNVTYEQGSYEPVPDRYRGFDVAFGFETLCYAQDLDSVAASIAATLRPGGRFVIYDVHRRVDLATVSADLALATRLSEVSAAVTRGFHASGAWEAALARAGLEVARTEDHTTATLPGLERFREIGEKTVSDWKKRLAVRVLPTYLSRNLIAGVLGPYIYERGDGKGTLVYEKITATRPAEGGV